MFLFLSILRLMFTSLLARTLQRKQVGQIIYDDIKGYFYGCNMYNWLFFFFVNLQ